MGTEEKKRERRGKSETVREREIEGHFVFYYNFRITGLLDQAQSSERRV